LTSITQTAYPQTLTPTNLLTIAVKQAILAASV